MLMNIQSKNYKHKISKLKYSAKHIDFGDRTLYHRIYYQSRRYGRWKISFKFINDFYIKRTISTNKKKNKLLTKNYYEENHLCYNWVFLYIFNIINIYRLLIYLVLVAKIFLVKYKPKTPAYRHYKNLFKKRLTLDDRFIFSFSYKTVNKAGRTKNGIVCRTKGSKTKLPFYRVSYLYKKLAVWSIVVGFFFSYAIRKYLHLIRYSTGSICLYKAINSVMLGDYIYSPGLNKLRYETLLGHKFYISLINDRQIFCDVFLPFKNKILYSRAQGVYSFVVYKIKDTNLVAVRVPTNKRVFLSNNSLATLGRPAGKWHKLEVQGSAGRNKIHGRKSIVRGVAQNPIDHPHGGRTKTISPEVSPWGWVTKKSH